MKDLVTLMKISKQSGYPFEGLPDDEPPHHGIQGEETGRIVKEKSKMEEKLAEGIGIHKK